MNSLKETSSQRRSSENDIGKLFLDANKIMRRLSAGFKVKILHEKMVKFSDPIIKKTYDLPPITSEDKKKLYFTPKELKKLAKEDKVRFPKPKITKISVVAKRNEQESKLSFYSRMEIKRFTIEYILSNNNDNFDDSASNKENEQQNMRWSKLIEREIIGSMELEIFVKRNYIPQANIYTSETEDSKKTASIRFSEPLVKGMWIIPKTENFLEKSKLYYSNEDILDMKRDKNKIFVNTTISNILHSLHQQPNEPEASLFTFQDNNMNDVDKLREVFTKILHNDINKVFLSSKLDSESSNIKLYMQKIVTGNAEKVSSVKSNQNAESNKKRKKRRVRFCTRTTPMEIEKIKKLDFCECFYSPSEIKSFALDFVLFSYSEACKSEEESKRRMLWKKLLEKELMFGKGRKQEKVLECGDKKRCNLSEKCPMPRRRCTKAA